MDDHRSDLDMEHPPLVSYPDDTVPNREDLTSIFHDYVHTIGRGDMLAEGDNKTQQDPSQFTRRRLLSLGHGPMCLNSYAVSQRGAQRLLYLASREIWAPIDVALSMWCRQEKLRCLVSVPSLFGQWKIKDAAVKNTDINEVKGDLKTKYNPSIGNSANVRTSVRKTLEKALFPKHLG